MSRVLIWKSLEISGGMDIFHPTDYETIWKNVLSQNSAINWGNKLWFQGIISEIDTPENELFFLSDETIEQINDKYDLIIYPMANFFGIEFCSDTTNLVSIFSRIKIPVFIIACGVQLKRIEDMDELIHAIASPASRFIETIYKTGGEFALRGHCSKDFFNSLGYKSAVVTGCPSLFQLGRDFQVAVSNFSRQEIVPIINGDMISFEAILKDSVKSCFISQDTYGEMLYNQDYFSHMSIMKDIRFVKNYGFYIADLISEDRIKMFADMSEWFNFIIAHDFNFSLGKRIHGSVMSILAGIPAMLIAIDVRTQEIAEFFDIPYIRDKDGYHYTVDDSIDLYNRTDYSKFNMNFKNRYIAYEKFLVDNGIVKQINEKNLFFSRKSQLQNNFHPNREKFAKYSKRLKREKPLIQSVIRLMK